MIREHDFLIEYMLGYYEQFEYFTDIKLFRKSGSIMLGEVKSKPEEENSWNCTYQNKQAIKHRTNL